MCTKPTTTVSNCDNYTNATTCRACKHGYNLVNNACVAITITDCGAYVSGSTTTCSLCLNKKLVSSDNTACSGSCTLANCDVCTSNTVCAKCSSGYSILNSTCIANTADSLKNCAVATSTTACSRCMDGYYDKDNVCVSFVSVFTTLIAIIVTLF